MAQNVKKVASKSLKKFKVAENSKSCRKVAEQHYLWLSLLTTYPLFLTPSPLTSYPLSFSPPPTPQNLPVIPYPSSLIPYPLPLSLTHTPHP